MPMSFKENYKRYSLIGIVLLLGGICLFELWSLLSGILGALTIYILLRKQMHFLVKKKRIRTWLAATLLLTETILLFLIPLVLFTNIVIEVLSNQTFDPQEFLAPIHSMSEVIQEKVGYDLFKPENLSAIFAQIPQLGQSLMSGIVNLFVNVFVLLFVLYFLLVGSESFEKFIYDILPFSDAHKAEVLHETKLIVTSNAIGIPLLAVVQGGIAMLGYYLFGVPNILLFGFLTAIATIIPVVGTGLIWVPLALYLLATGDWVNALGLTAYGALIVSQIDNLVRLTLQKTMADTHPLITLFGVVIGLPLFGFMGVIFGPLILSMFVLCLTIFRKEYLS